MKTKKTLAILLAVMMILSSVPMFASAAEAPTVTEWPTVVGQAEVGMTYGDLTLQGGSASVPGTFGVRSQYVDRAITAPSTTGMSVRLTFTPDDTEAYTVVTAASSLCPKVLVNPCSNPVLQGDITATQILKGTAIGTSELSVGAGSAVLAYTTDITNRIDTITFDNPDKVYTELGTYEEPVTIKFKTTSHGAYAVDLKATAKIKVADKLAAKISVLPKITNTLCAEGDTAAKIMLSGGTTDIPGKFTVTNPDQPLVVGENVINITFTPDDLTKYDPSTVDVIVTLKQGAKVPENCVLELEYNSSRKFSNISNMKFPESGIEPADASVYVMGLVDQPELYKTVALVGEYKALINIYKDGELVGENAEVTIKVVPGKATGQFLRVGATADIQDDGSYLIKINHSSSQEAPILNGTTRVKVNGEVIAEYPVSKTSNETQYVATKSGHYEISVDYIAADGDYVTYETTELVCGTSYDFEITMPRTITAENCEVLGSTTADGKFVPGTEVRASSYVVENLENFGGWVFKDENGNEFTPEGYRVTDSSGTGLSIAFTMPNHDMSIKPIINEIIIDDGDDSLIPDIDIDLDGMTDGSHKLKIVNFFKNLVEMIKAFIQQIGDFFSNMSLDSLGEVIG